MRSPSSLHLLKILFIFLNLSLFAQEKVIKDSLGESFYLKNPPEKIVSLSPAITEILYFIGAGERIVGVTRYCDFPEEAKKKEKIGGIIDVDIEKILKIKPDIVFATRGNPLEVIERIKTLGVKVFAIDTGEKIEEIFVAMRKIAFVTGNLDSSMKKINELEEKVKEIEKRARAKSVKQRIFLKLGSKGLWTCGRRTFINDLILKAGFENIADFKDGWFEINIETLINKNPDIIIILTKNKNDFFSTKEFILSIPGISFINAVKNKRIYPLNVDLIERPGPRIVEGLDEIYRISIRDKE